MNINLEKLNTAVGFLVNQKTFSEKVGLLSEEIKRSRESFVWSVIDLNSIECELP